MYLARDLELGIFRAVKELPASSRREAGLLRLLEHPYLPKMIDYTERGNFCYIIMADLWKSICRKDMFFP